MAVMPSELNLIQDDSKINSEPNTIFSHLFLLLSEQNESNTTKMPATAHIAAVFVN